MDTFIIDANNDVIHVFTWPSVPCPPRAKVEMKIVLKITHYSVIFIIIFLFHFRNRPSFILHLAVCAVDFDPEDSFNYELIHILCESIVNDIDMIAQVSH